MPIDMSRYPVDWPQIRDRVLKRAGGSAADLRIGAACEWCGVMNYSVGYRDSGGELHALDRVFPSYRKATRAAIKNNQLAGKSGKHGRYIVIVLTIAHIHDPDPANCADDNLAALCQQCHNRHDSKMRQRNRAAGKARAAKAAGQMTLL